MSNKGLANHIRFRTKYWQERQQLQQRDAFLDHSIVQGEKITRLPFDHPALRRMDRDTRTPSPTQRKGSVQNARRDSRMALKL